MRLQKWPVWALLTLMVTGCGPVVVTGPHPPVAQIEIYPDGMPVWEYQLRERARLEAWPEPYYRSEYLRMREYHAGHGRWHHHY